MQSKRVVGLSLDKDVLNRIDEDRGLIKRSTFLNDLIAKTYPKTVYADDRTNPDGTGIEHPMRILPDKSTPSPSYPETKVPSPWPEKTITDTRTAKDKETP